MLEAAASAPDAHPLEHTPYKNKKKERSLSKLASTIGI